MAAGAPSTSAFARSTMSFKPPCRRRGHCKERCAPEPTTLDLRARPRSIDGRMPASRHARGWARRRARRQRRSSPTARSRLAVSALPVFNSSWSCVILLNPRMRGSSAWCKRLGRETRSRERARRGSRARRTVERAILEEANLWRLHFRFRAFESGRSERRGWRRAHDRDRRAFGSADSRRERKVASPPRASTPTASRLDPGRRIASGWSGTTRVAGAMLGCAWSSRMKTTSPSRTRSTRQFTW